MNGRIRQFLPYFLMIFAALAIIFRPELLSGILGGIWQAAAPITAGVLLAAIIDPAVKKAEKLLTGRGRRLGKRAARGISIAAVYILIGAVLAAVVMIIIPRLAKSVTLFANSFDSYYAALRRQLYSLSDSSLLGLFGRFDKLIEVLSAELPLLFKKTFTATAGVLKTAANILLGVVLSVYILADKERLLDFIRGASRSLFSEKTYVRMAEIITAVYGSLVSYISGQLTEAVILGTLCFFGMVIFGFAYPLLISTIIGVTALVPVVGAFAGSIPAVFMLFLVKPSSALWFIVFIIVLQQLENNLIYPKVVGKSVGLPPLLVFTAIIIGAQIGGAVGIMLGIPILSAVYVLVRARLTAER